MSKKDRKAMLSGLIGSGPEKASEVSRPARPTLPRRGAIGAISSAVSGLRAAGIIEIKPDVIRDGGLQDRIETNLDDDAALKRSIETHGQQVPVLVRPHPNEDGIWQIVYGRRRVQAARELGIAVKALVRDLDDAALIMAQGQENSARRDLSFIEKAHFAWRMAEAGYERTTICDALSIDKSLVSRMLSIIERLPDGVVQKIGAAHGTGRPRWTALIDMIEALRLSDGEMDDLLLTLDSAEAGERFNTLFQALKGRLVRGVPKENSTLEIRSSDGKDIAQAVRVGKQRQLSVSLVSDDGFGDWLLKRLPDVYAEWMKSEKDR